MSERRSRAIKAINYASLDNGLSEDEDFVDFTPPVKKKKVYGKEKRTAKNKENEKNSSNIGNVKKKSPKQRPSLDERKFQRELEMALKMSKKGEDILDNFDNEDKFSGFAVGDEENCNKDECFSEYGPNTPVMNDSGVLKSITENVEESIASTSFGLPEKRRMKKVNFVEDEDSDDWTENNSSDSSPESDADEDFCPSPQKKIPKREMKKKLNSKVKSKVKDNIIEREKLDSHINIVAPVSADKPNKLSADMSLKSVANVCLDANYASVSPMSSSSPKPFPLLLSKSPVKSPIILKRSHPTNSSTPESGNLKSSFSLVKTPFKSPSMGSNISNEFQKSSSVKTGLRLGLSRSRNVKPLHPNVCIR